jgi:hypothetical protein
MTRTAVDGGARAARWAGALLVLAALLVVAVLSSTGDHARMGVCQRASGSTELTCRPLQTGDPQVLLVVLLAMLLMLPDLKTLKIAGLVEFEQKVNDAAHAASDAAARAETAAVRIEQAAVAHSASAAAANVNLTLLPAGAVVQVPDETLDAKAAAFRGLS